MESFFEEAAGGDLEPAGELSAKSIVWDLGKPPSLEDNGAVEGGGALEADRIRVLEGTARFRLVIRAGEEGEREEGER